MKIIKRVLKLFALTLLSVLICFSAYTLFMTKVLNKDYVNVFGYTYFVVASGSMSGTIEVNDIIIVKIADEYAVNDIITYNDNGTFTTHRVTKITDNEVITRGDVNNIDDSPISKESVIGKVSLVISISLLLKIFALIIFALVIYIILDFDNIFKKYIVKGKKTKKRNLPLEYTYVFKLNDLEVEQSLEDNIEKKNGKNEKNNKSDYEKKFLELVLKMFKAKKKVLKLTTQGSLKIKYLYELAVTALIDPLEIPNCLKNTTFEEMYDYDFEEVLFSKNIQNKLYEMPMYIFLKLLVYCLLYDEAEFFDATFKVLKYKVQIDKDSLFIKNNKNITEALELIENTIKEVGHEEAFELDFLREKVRINNEIKNISKTDNNILNEKEETSNLKKNKTAKKASENLEQEQNVLKENKMEKNEKKQHSEVKNEVKKTEVKKIEKKVIKDNSKKEKNKTNNSEISPKNNHTARRIAQYKKQKNNKKWDSCKKHCV